MENDKYVNNIIKKAILLNIIEIVIVLLFFDDKIPLALGFVLGGGLSIIFFRLLYLNILIAISKSEDKAKRYITINYILRYIIYGIVLYLAGKLSVFNIFTCAIGLLTIKLVLYIKNLISFFRK